MVERADRDVSEDLGSAILSRPLVRNEPVEFLHSGSTILNLAASGRGRHGGWARARVNNVVGDGSSGKTILALEFAFRSFRDLPGLKTKLFPKVNKLEIVYDNIETVMDFDLEQMFWPYGKDFMKFLTWRRSETVEEMGARFFKRTRAIKPGHCLVYIVDSWDALDSEEDLKKFEADLNKRIAGKTPKVASDDEQKTKGSYDLGKQRYASKRFFKKICTEIATKDVTLLVVSQTRQKIGITFGKKKYRAGGDALDFYTHQVAWLYERKKHKRTILGQEKTYAIDVMAKFERNKTYKPFNIANVRILYDYGVDDLTSMLQFLHGVESKQVEFDGTEFNYEELIKYVEDNNKEDEIIDLVEEKWARIEEELRPKRKPKR